MKTWLIANGDLAIGAGGYATVSGPDKLAQDLRLVTLEPFGTDRFHPAFGSLFFSYIGTATTPATATTLRAEITRILQNYILVQTDKITTTQAAGQRSQYGTGEIVSAVPDITILQDPHRPDLFRITVTIRTASGQTISLESTVNT